MSKEKKEEKLVKVRLKPENGIVDYQDVVEDPFGFKEELDDAHQRREDAKKKKKKS